ncbi:PGF-pre-PGF domain-containing protein, partial [Candidatus Woesearchaeota archaeon]|nr:PGF-pre-PGF domain-containing protein [Candidatus Woesearchaeota archaeon]
DARWPSFFETTKTVVTELKTLTPVLVSPTLTASITTTEDIDVMIKEYNGQKYLITANRHNTPTTASFDVSSLGPDFDSAIVIFEDRIIPILSRQFTDSFDSYDVHVYQLTTPPFCGDTLCNGLEDCSSCEIDCGVCICSDGTPYGSCTLDRTLFCQDGLLVENCLVGCPTCVSPYSCDLDTGFCTPPPTCSDGTLYGECSLDRTHYCQDGSLVENCLVGCPLCGIDYVCNPADGTCVFQGEEEGPICGDTFCDFANGEDCETCSDDCLVPGYVCCDATTYQGDCCSSSDCLLGQICDNNQCCSVSCDASTCPAGQTCINPGTCNSYCYSPPIPPSPPSGDGGGSGGGGGGGGSSRRTISEREQPPAEIEQIFIYHTEFEEEIQRVSVSYEAKQEKQITISIEEPKSSLPLSEGVIFKSFTLSIKNATIIDGIIDFAVSKKWIAENDVNVSTIILQQFNEEKNQWQKLPTTQTNQEYSPITGSAISAQKQECKLLDVKCIIKKFSLEKRVIGSNPRVSPTDYLYFSSFITEQFSSFTITGAKNAYEPTLETPRQIPQEQRKASFLWLIFIGAIALLYFLFQKKQKHPDAKTKSLKK